MKKVFLLTTLLISLLTMAQAQQTDTVTVELARTSKITFTIEDKNDLEQLKHYDFNALFEDIFNKLASGDTVELPTSDSFMGEEFESAFDDDDDEEMDEEEDDEEPTTPPPPAISTSRSPLHSAASPSSGWTEPLSPAGRARGRPRRARCGAPPSRHAPRFPPDRLNRDTRRAARSRRR